MKIKIALITLASVLSVSSPAQTVVKLWGNQTPPIDNGLTGEEKMEGVCITNVSQPTLTIFLPKKSINRHAALVICPGGGYSGLAIDHEGYQLAKWLQKQGIAGIVLKYRLPNKHKKVPLTDAQEALKYIRLHANSLDIDTAKVGIAGFSAGGHLAATASTHFHGSASLDRPDFSILFYPVVTMGEKTHGGSRDNLLGDNPTKEDIIYYSNELQVTPATPPTLLMLSDDDGAVSPENSTSYYDALKKNKIAATMYIFPEGGHGWGMHPDFKYHKEMLSLLKSWLDKTLGSPKSQTSN